MSLIRIYNGATPTTAALTKVTTGTAIKTLLQVKCTRLAKVTAWGISFDGTAAATPIATELIETGTVFATVTAAVEADLVKQGHPDMDAIATEQGIEVGTTATGYTASGEGTVTASRLFDYQLIAPTNQYLVQFPLGREPMVNHDTSLRVRVTAGAAVNAVCWIELEL